jgi:hypothetical protein
VDYGLKTERLAIPDKRREPNYGEETGGDRRGCDCREDDYFEESLYVVRHAFRHLRNGFHVFQARVVPSIEANAEISNYSSFSSGPTFSAFGDERRGAFQYGPKLAVNSSLMT